MALYICIKWTEDPPPRLITCPYKLTTQRPVPSPRRKRFFPKVTAPCSGERDKTVLSGNCSQSATRAQGFLPTLITLKTCLLFTAARLWDNCRKKTISPRLFGPYVPAMLSELSRGVCGGSSPCQLPSPPSLRLPCHVTPGIKTWGSSSVSDNSRFSGEYSPFSPSSG